MQQASENPFKGKTCVVFLKSSIIFQGKMTVTGAGIETEILQWLHSGVFLSDGSFVPFSNISSISPMPVEE